MENLWKTIVIYNMPVPCILIGQYSEKSDYNFLYSYGVGITVNYNDKTVQYEETNDETKTRQSWWQRL